MSDIRDRYVREYDLNTGRPGDQGGGVKPIVEFFNHAFENEEASKQQGRPIYVEKTLVRIMVPGDLKNIVERKATDEDKRMYAREWSAFERQETMAMEGTPLEQWPLMSRHVVRQLKGSAVYTVEQLAGLDDVKLMEVGVLGGRTLRKQAQEWLRNAETGAVSTALVAENDTLKQRVTNLEEALRTANDRYEALLREKGRDASAHEPVTAAPVAKPVEPTLKHGIPTDWQKFETKALIALVSEKLGLKVNSRMAAENAIKDALED